MRLASGSFSHTGLVRGNNEDAYLVDVDHMLFAVADGVGGHRGGEVASRTAIEALKAKLAQGRATCALFDTARFARHVESAYQTMWQRHAAGQPPTSFVVQAAG